MMKVAKVNRKHMLECICTWEVVDKIYRSHSSETERLHACADAFVNCKPNSSWEKLIENFYESAGIGAAKQAKAFLQEKGWCHTCSIWLCINLALIQCVSVVTCYCCSSEQDVDTADK